MTDSAACSRPATSAPLHVCWIGPESPQRHFQAYPIPCKTRHRFSGSSNRTATLRTVTACTFR